MKKKYLLGLVLVFLTVNLILVSTKAENEVVYSLEGNITYKKNMLPPVYILYNLTIPIELYGGDTLYWYQKYSGECDVLTISIHFDFSGTNFDNFVYINPGEPHDICENTKKYTIPNDSYGGNDKYIIVRKTYLNRDYSYHLTWEFWIERDIVEPSDNDIIGINIIPFLIGFMCISVILIYQKLKKLK